MFFLEKAAFYLFLLFLPFNIKKYIATGFTSGNITEFNSYFIYFSDILLTVFLALWLVRILKPKNKFFERQKSLFYFLVIFIVIGFFSSFTSRYASFALYNSLRVLMGIGLFLYTINNFRLLHPKNIFALLAAGGAFQAVIAFGQYLFQSSLHLKYLGESFLGKDIAGVAKINFAGSKIIRAYGTFPHPNLLSAFLLISLFAFLSLFLGNYYRKNKESLFLKDIILFLGASLAILGLFLTFSRSSLILGFTGITISLLYFNFKRNLCQVSPLRLNCFLGALTGIFFIFGILFLPQISARFQSEPQSVELRSFYNRTAYQIFQDTPLIGVGPGNFPRALSQKHPYLKKWQYQPSHNIYLLILSERGILGLWAFLAFLAIALKKMPIRHKFYKPEAFLFSVLAISFLIIGTVDHFFVSTNQGILMFWLVFGIALQNINPKQLTTTQKSHL